MIYMVVVTRSDKLSTGAPRVPATSPRSVSGLCPGTKDFLGQGREKKLNVHKLVAREYRLLKKEKRLPSVSGGFRSVKTSLSPAHGQILKGCLPLLPSQAVSVGAPEPEFLHQPDLENLRCTEANRARGYKNQAELGSSLTNTNQCSACRGGEGLKRRPETHFTWFLSGGQARREWETALLQSGLPGEQHQRCVRRCGRPPCSYRPPGLTVRASLSSSSGSPVLLGEAAASESP